MSPLVCCLVMSTKDDPGPAWDSAAMSSDVAVWLTCDTSFKIIKCTPKFADFIGSSRLLKA
eukprot:266068-Amphidinium_carterae.1